MTVVSLLRQQVPRTYPSALRSSSTLPSPCYCFNVPFSSHAFRSSIVARSYHAQRVPLLSVQRRQPVLLHQQKNLSYFNNKYNLRCFSQTPPSRSVTFGDQVSKETLSPRAPSRLRPTLWALLVGTLIFSYAVYETSFDTALRVRMMNQGLTSAFSNLVNKITGYSSDRIELELARMRKRELKAKLDAFILSCQNIGGVELKKAAIIVSERLFALTESQRTVLMLIGLQGVVFLAWQVPPWRRFMASYFTHFPLSGRSYTMLTSTFSHQNFMHFAFNSYAFWGFGTAAHDYLYRPVRTYFDLERDESRPHVLESTARYHFIAFFMLAGIASSLASHLYSLTIRAPRMVNAALSSSKAATRNRILPSLGASGAIYATVVLTACAFPNENISLIFLPMFTIPINYGVCGLVALDIFGILRGWRLFDHVAHVGGALFGYLYYLCGPDIFDAFRWAVEEDLEELQE